MSWIVLLSYSLYTTYIYIIDGPNNHAACVVRYFNDSENQESQEDASDDLIYKGYKAVLDSKSKDETLVTLVNFFFFLIVKLNISKSSVVCGSRSYKTEIKQALQASWEPRWSTYWHRIPWRQYKVVGVTLLHFSYAVVALHGCLLSEIQVLYISIK